MKQHIIFGNTHINLAVVYQLSTSSVILLLYGLASITLANQSKT
ncbi:hypothetical protein PSPO_b1682 [Pseudoalteromonas spongiae UST010723-006]|nr:hypothetical protein PSPO_b1682 [Pseudoalteromonas spongiae UST010723-006]